MQTLTPYYEIFVPQDPFKAMGMATSHLMTKENFRQLTFVEAGRLIAGQINRGHYFFVRQKQSIVGYAGWALCSEAAGDLWLSRNIDVPLAEAESGDCILLNMWQADAPDINPLIVRELQRRNPDKKFLFAKRFYNSGNAVRPLKLPIFRTTRTTRH